MEMNHRIRIRPIQAILKSYLNGNTRARMHKRARLRVPAHLAEAELQNCRFFWGRYLLGTINALRQFFITSRRNTFRVATALASVPVSACYRVRLMAWKWSTLARRDLDMCGQISSRLAHHEEPALQSQSVNSCARGRGRAASRLLRSGNPGIIGVWLLSSANIRLASGFSAHMNFFFSFRVSGRNLK